MKVKIDPMTSLPQVELEEKDLEDARKIQQMMEGEGWKVLQGYFEVAREAMLDSGKLGIKTRGKRDLSDIRWAVLSGWDERSAIPQRIVDRAQEFLDAKKEQEEESHESRIYDGNEG